MPKGVPNKAKQADLPDPDLEDGAVAPMVPNPSVGEDTMQSASDVVEDVQRASSTAAEGTPTILSTDKEYFVLTMITDNTPRLVQRLERAGMSFKVVELDEKDVRDIKNGYLTFLPKT